MLQFFTSCLIPWEISTEANKLSTILDFQGYTCYVSSGMLERTRKSFQHAIWHYALILANYCLLLILLRVIFKDYPTCDVLSSKTYPWLRTVHTIESIFLKYQTLSGLLLIMLNVLLNRSIQYFYCQCLSS